MSRTVFTIFSDDVRHEIGGKVSYMGVYSGSLLVASFPTVLPKLCLSLKISTPVDQPFEKLLVKVFKDDELIAEGDLPKAELEADPSEPLDADVDRSHAFKVVQMGFAFAPFVIDKPGLLRVRVENESEELRGTGLKMELAPEGVMLPFIS